MKKNLFKKRKKCRLCDSAKVKQVLSMPSSQPVDNFRPFFDPEINLPLFEMDLYQCEKCGHAQLLDIVNPDILYGNYIYKSTSSPDLKSHFSNYASFLFNHKYIKKNQKVLDIGSNDGLFLDYLKQRGAVTYGIDPAKAVSNIAKKKGHYIFNDYLSTSSIKKIKKSFDLITANNVFSHSDNLQKSLNCINKLLSKKGTYIFEVSYLLDTINNRVIDYIYHEHLSYHSIKSLKPFLKKEKLYIYDVIKVQTKGGSIRVVCGKNKKNENISLVNSMIAAEKEKSIYNQNLYNLLSFEISNSREILNRWIESVKKKFSKTQFIGYGACATGTVLTRMMNLDNHLSGFIEDNKDKHGYLSPNSFLPVVSLESIKNTDNIIIIILAWRFKDQIIKRIRKRFGKKLRVISVMPNIKKIVEL